MKSLTKYSLLVPLVLWFIGCSNSEKSSSSEPYLFTQLDASQSGIQFQNTITETDSLNILDYLYFYNGGGVALGDINNDGLIDIYLTANQETNKLYLNKGNLTFEDITTKAGVAGNSDWNTGVMMADINADGWLDIYTIAVVGINDFEGYNELFINNGNGTFTERAKEYNLAIQAYGTHAVSLDYDADGDLDIFLLNHAVHTQESFGKVTLRNIRNGKTGDRLLRNDNGTFTDVSEEAGIFGGINGYGLGVSVADFNKDGLPDIYIGNDFHEDDYFYVNQGDGTFKEQLRNYFSHTSRFSMGNDVADLNHDGYPDLISLDMLPEDETVIKSSEGDEIPQTLKLRTEEYGYHYQFSRNMLFLSQPNAPYLETALLSEVAATDWSWSALFADYDLDGIQDLFISNGIPKRPNDLDYINFISNSQIQNQLNTSRLVDQKAIEMMPDGTISNYFFKGQKGIQFENVSNTWTMATPSISGASALADLDNDGDLDIVSNNINATPTIYINSSSDTGNFLNIKLNYSAHNPSGIGTKIYCYNEGNFQYKELYPSHGFQATSEPIINYGLGTYTQVDSLVVIWPNSTKEVLSSVASNQTLKIQPKNTIAYSHKNSNSTTLFKKTANNLGIDYIHQEDEHLDFNYQKLIPYQVSDRGPALAIGDLNLDGKEDVFIGGAKNQKAGIFVKTEQGFERTYIPEIDNDSLAEDVSAMVVNFDANTEYMFPVARGGNVINPSLKVFKNSIYFEENNVISEPLDKTLANTQVVKINIEDTEFGAQIFIGNHSKPLDFGAIPNSTIEGSNFPEKLQKIGMVTDALFTDFNNDGIQDLIVVGEWMSPRFYELKDKTWRESFPLKGSLNGLWQRIHPFDIDEDGDLDYLLGNWGTNTKFKASETAPMKMYYSDFDENGTTETVVTIEKDGKYYPLLGLNELASQMVFLRKKFNTYKEFAGKTVAEVFEEKLDLATVFEVHTLASGYLENNNGTFQFKAFGELLQLSPLKAFCTFDFDNDGKEEVLTGGNYFGVIPFHGRFDSFPGALIKVENKTELVTSLGIDFSHKSVRHLAIIYHKEKPYLLVIYNNDKTEVYEITS